VSIDPDIAEGSPLGKPTAYPERYDPSLLFSLPRAPQREALGIAGALPFGGADFWTAYELSWLDPRGKPQLALARFRVPAHSPHLVESKSLKLYLGSFAQEKLAGPRELCTRVESDLSSACGSAVAVTFSRFGAATAAPDAPLGESIDDIALDTDVYEPDSSLLAAGGTDTEETLRTALFRSRCPVTGQPDYADVTIRYRGPRIDRTALLRYLVSYRRHPAFHESCVERIFVDVLHVCRSRYLTVFGRFLRRGGIDINPFRSNFEDAPAAPERSVRQ
jgi:7-cyano-7-deazaguanine reductase